MSALQLALQRIHDGKPHNFETSEQAMLLSLSNLSTTASFVYLECLQNEQGKWTVRINNLWGSAFGYFLALHNEQKPEILMSFVSAVSYLLNTFETEENPTPRPITVAEFDQVLDNQMLIATQIAEVTNNPDDLCLQLLLTHQTVGEYLLNTSKTSGFLQKVPEFFFDHNLLKPNEDGYNYVDVAHYFDEKLTNNSDIKKSTEEV